ncbi:MAG: hypothetical protein KGM98_09745 [Bacteroidota bacterium]|nr:hypothetical protein [Bacteroidota bacterium]
MKNGKVSDITNGAPGISAFNIFVSGCDVYESGALYLNGVYVPKYWKNGVETILAAAGDLADGGQIFVSGNYVYVAGPKGNYEGYWKKMGYLPPSLMALKLGTVV